MSLSSICRLLILATTFWHGANQANADLILYSQYNFNGNFTDSMGNSSDLVTIGSPNFNSGKLDFGLSDGVTLNSSLFAGDYRVEFDASFTDLNAYKKLLDFQDRSADRGFYFQSGVLTFYPSLGTGSTTVNLNIQHTIGLEKIGSNVTAYLDGIQQFTFASPSEVTPSSNNLHFFVDDFVTGSEGSIGSVDSIRLYVTAVPEPSSLFLAGIAGSLFVTRFRVRKR